MQRKSSGPSLSVWRGDTTIVVEEPGTRKERGENVGLHGGEGVGVGVGGEVKRLDGKEKGASRWKGGPKGCRAWEGWSWGGRGYIDRGEY